MTDLRYTMQPDAPTHAVLAADADGVSYVTEVPGWDRWHAEDFAAVETGPFHHHEYLGPVDDPTFATPPDWWADAPTADDGDGHDR